MKQLLVTLSLVLLSVGCRHLENRVTRLNLECGADFKGIQGSVFKAFSPSDAEILGSELEAEGLTRGEGSVRQNSLPVSSKACVAYDVQSSPEVLVRSHASDHHWGALVPTAGLAFLEKVFLKDLNAGALALDCPGPIDSRGPVTFPLKTTAQTIDRSYQLTVKVQNQLKATVDQHSFSVPSGPSVSFSLPESLPDGVYQLQFALESLLDEKNSKTRLRELSCPLHLDRQAPSLNSSLSGSTTLAQVSPGETIVLKSGDQYPSQLSYCLLPEDAQECTETQWVHTGESSTTLAAPSKGRWQLLVRARDRAGNESVIERKKFAVFHKDLIREIGSTLDLIEANRFDDAMKPVVQLLRTMSWFESLTLPEEREGLKYRIEMAATRLNRGYHPTHALEFSSRVRIGQGTEQKSDLFWLLEEGRISVRNSRGEEISAFEDPSLSDTSRLYVSPDGFYCLVATSPGWYKLFSREDSEIKQFALPRGQGWPNAVDWVLARKEFYIWTDSSSDPLGVRYQIVDDQINAQPFPRTINPERPSGKSVTSRALSRDSNALAIASANIVEIYKRATDGNWLPALVKHDKNGRWLGVWELMPEGDRRRFAFLNELKFYIWNEGDADLSELKSLGSGSLATLTCMNRFRSQSIQKLVFFDVMLQLENPNQFLAGCPGRFSLVEIKANNNYEMRALDGIKVPEFSSMSEETFPFQWAIRGRTLTITTSNHFYLIALNPESRLGAAELVDLNIRSNLMEQSILNGFSKRALTLDARNRLTFFERNAISPFWSTQGGLYGGKTFWAGFGADDEQLEIVNYQGQLEAFTPGGEPLAKVSKVIDQRGLQQDPKSRRTLRFGGKPAVLVEGEAQSYPINFAEDDTYPIADASFGWNDNDIFASSGRELFRWRLGEDSPARTTIAGLYTGFLHTMEIDGIPLLMVDRGEVGDLDNPEWFDRDLNAVPLSEELQKIAANIVHPATRTLFAQVPNVGQMGPVRAYELGLKNLRPIDVEQPEGLFYVSELMFDAKGEFVLGRLESQGKVMLCVWRRLASGSFRIEALRPVDKYFFGPVHLKTFWKGLQAFVVADDEKTVVLSPQLKTLYSIAIPGFTRGAAPVFSPFSSRVAIEKDNGINILDLNFTRLRQTLCSQLQYFLRNSNVLDRRPAFSEDDRVLCDGNLGVTPK